MDDKTLLERAAIAWFGDKATWVRHCCRSNENDSRRWNALEDDGDALRLAVKLEIDIVRDGNFIECMFWSDRDACELATVREPVEGNPCAATRRAIVRAAAALAGD